MSRSWLTFAWQISIYLWINAAKFRPASIFHRVTSNVKVPTANCDQLFTIWQYQSLHRSVRMHRSSLSKLSLKNTRVSQDNSKYKQRVLAGTHQSQCQWPPGTFGRQRTTMSLWEPRAFCHFAQRGKTVSNCMCYKLSHSLIRLPIRFKWMGHRISIRSIRYCYLGVQ